MNDKISMVTKIELTHALGYKYRQSSKAEKAQILNQFITVSGYHRKYAIWL